MARNTQPLEFRTFDGGFITETNYLDSNPNSTLEEANFEVDTKGIRRRRLGLQYEDGHPILDTGDEYTLTSTPMVTSYLWENVAGSSAVTFLVVQYNNKILIFDTDSNQIAGRILTQGAGIEVLPNPLHRTPFDFASVDGDLVIVTGGQEINILSAIGLVDGAISDSIVFDLKQERLLVRDTFGLPVTHTVNNKGEEERMNLQDPRYINFRPESNIGADIPNFKTDIAVTNVVLTEDSEISSESLRTNNTQGGNRPSTFIPSTWQDGALRQFIVTKSYIEFSVSGITDDSILMENLPVGDALQEFRRTNSGVYRHNISSLTYSGWKSWAKTGTKFSFSKDIPYQSCGWVSQGGDHNFVCETKYRTVTDQGWVQSLTFTVRVPDPVIDPGDLTPSLRAHYYNLRNQTWAEKRLVKGHNDKVDPIADFYTKAESKVLPSNTDNIYSAYYPDPEDSENKTANRFHSIDLFGNPAGNIPAPKGYFIIDALQRSSSRFDQWKVLAHKEDHTVDGDWEYLNNGEPVSLPFDETKGGSRSVAEYAGRLWYGGFSGDGEENETRLESFLLYSQLTNSRSGYWRCYQENDPTSYDAPDIKATDGGVVPLDGAYGIQRMVQVGNALIVFAANGVWSVSGNDGNLFSPTSQRVFKLTDKASIATRSIVVVDNVVYFWALDGIYQITVSAKGNEAQLANITYDTIHSYYVKIPPTTQSFVSASFDPYEGYISWVWNNTLDREGETEILRFKPTTGAFFRHIVKDGAKTRTLLAPISVTPFVAGQMDDEVFVDDDAVVADGFDVIISTKGIMDRPATVKMLVAHKLDNNNTGLFFADFSNEAYMDWGEEDAEAYMVTSYFVGEDTQRRKEVPYMTCHFERTEDEFVINDVTGDIVYKNPSKCQVQSHWDWTTSSVSGKWSKPFEAYRLQRHFVPSGIGAADGGYATTVTKNKLRGRGRALSLKFNTQEYRDCRILGYGLMWMGGQGARV